MSNLKLKDVKLAIVGLGYVGLPLAIEFGKIIQVIAYDKNKKRINELRKAIDRNKEVSKIEFKKSKYLKLTNSSYDLRNSNCFIVTVPTPVKSNNAPDFSYLIAACKNIGKFIKKNNIVIFESTVYPGATEEVCVPILEKVSKLKYKSDFFCGYSPERINPGDKKHNLVNIKKIVSATDKKTLSIINKIYKQIIKVGTYKVDSIKVAEAAKVIENTQRDLNIALINEISIIFNKMNIDTESVLKAAGTKWNFLPFKPGLVGGHCIGVDPYYLTSKAKAIGYKTKIILAGRSLNDSMGKYIGKNLKDIMKKKKIIIKHSKILIMGLTFKEDCKDIRNTKVVDIYKYLLKFTKNIDLYDPIASKTDIFSVYNKYPITRLKNKYYDSIIIAVPHKLIKGIGIKKIRSLCKIKNVVYDIKSAFDIKDSDLRL